MKRIVMVLTLLLSFAIFAQSVDAAQVLKKTSNLFGEPKVTSQGVEVVLSGTVKYIQHAKYLSPDFKIPDDVGITRANTRITRTVYTCPGYYTSRIYSDTRGQQLLGYQQIYVSAADIKNSNCDSIKLPPNTPPPTTEKPDPPISVTPPAPKSDTHPIPSFEGVTSTPTATKPKITPEVKPPPPTQTFQQMCEGYYGDDRVKYEKVPTTLSVNEGELCCPVSNKNSETPGDLKKIVYVQNVNSDMYYGAHVPGSLNSGWGCSGIASGYTVADTYCPEDLKYNATTKTCDEETIKGDIGDWPTDPKSYEQYLTVSDESILGEYSNNPVDPDPEPGEPDPENPNPEEEVKTCECKSEFMAGYGYLCCVFECPGWADFKGFLANDVVGTVEAPPVPDLSAPSFPNIFDVLNSVDERNPAKPTGQEDPGLSSATFDANDVKSGEQIQFEEDPTGGFNIENPLETLDANLADPPQPEMEVLEYPGGSGSSENGKPPEPSNDGKIEYPDNPSGTLKPPTTGGTVKPPTTGGSIKYPGT